MSFGTVPPDRPGRSRHPGVNKEASDLLDGQFMTGRVRWLGAVLFLGFHTGNRTKCGYQRARRLSPPTKSGLAVIKAERGLAVAHR